MMHRLLRFEDPWVLILLCVIPILIYAYIKGFGHARVRFSSIRSLTQLRPSRSLYLRHGLIGLRCLCLGLIIVAMARPQLGNKQTEYTSEGIDIILCIDTSGSMRALDFSIEGTRVDRLTAVKEVVKGFIQARKSDRIGMVVFGEQAFTQCPLTLDYGVLLSFLDRVTIGMAGEDKTAIGDAIAIGVKRLKALEKAKSRVMILLTDGRNNAGRIDPRTAAMVAQEFGVRIYTIGAGTEGEAPFLVDHPLFGKQYVYQRVDLDEDTLQEIARITEGHYFRAQDAKALEQVYDQIDRLEKTEVKVKEYMEYNELFWWFLIPALLLLVTEVVLSQTRFRKIP
ncbi:MAG: vWA domain-containing protein [bacterium]